MIDVRAHAIRFADLWAVDAHQMVDEIYADDIEMESMADPSRLIRGAAELHAVEDDLLQRIPRHRHELVRVIADEEVACLETIIVGPTTGEFAPACVWWWRDPSGKVAAEVGWFDWADRNTDASVTHGTVPANPAAGEGRPHGWHRDLADRFADTWVHDPLGAHIALHHDACTFGRVGLAETLGAQALHASLERRLADLPLGERWMRVHRSVGEGSVVAILFSAGNDDHFTRGTVVLTLGHDGAIVSRRMYAAWSKAIPRRAPSRVAVGDEDWVPPPTEASTDVAGRATGWAAMSAHLPLGDPVPYALAEYYRRLDAGDALGAAECFSPDVVYAVTVPGRSVPDEPIVIRGREELAEWFTRRSSRRMEHRVELSACVGDAVLMEGRVFDVATSTVLIGFVGTATLDAQGLVRRYVAFSDRVVPDEVAPDRLSRSSQPFAEADIVDRRTIRAAAVGEYAVGRHHLVELVVTLSDGRPGSLLRSATEDASAREVRRLSVFASPPVPAL